MSVARVWLWLLVALPIAVQTYRYLGESIYYGEYVHWTGLQATRLLIVTLAITPLKLTFRRSPLFNWLLLHRRDLGLGAFLYAAAHAVAYLAYREPARILEELTEAGMLTGWLALVIMLALAATSNNASVRRLGGRWKRLHRNVYLLALLTFAHWILTAFDPTSGYLHLGVLLLLLGLRTWQLRRNRIPPG